MALVKNLRRRVRLNKQLQQWKKDRAILLICLGIALSLWIPTKMGQVYRMEKRVRLEFVLPEAYTFRTVPPQDMKVVLEGRGWNLFYDYLRSREMLLRFETGSVQEFILNRGQLRTSILDQLHGGNIKIVEINYDALNLQLEPRAQRKLPVRFAGKLNFQSDFHLKSNIVVKPSEVLVSGPASQLQLFQSIPTDSLVFGDLSEDVRRSVKLALAPEFQTEPAEVEILIPVEQYTEKQVFVPIQPVRSPDSIRLFPGQVRISFQVGLSRYNQITSADFTVTAELPRDPSSTRTDKAALILTRTPPLLRNIRITPDSADFLIQVK